MMVNWFTMHTERMWGVGITYIFQKFTAQLGFIKVRVQIGMVGVINSIVQALWNLKKKVRKNPLITSMDWKNWWCILMELETKKQRSQMAFWFIANTYRRFGVFRFKRSQRTSNCGNVIYCFMLARIRIQFYIEFLKAGPHYLIYGRFSYRFTQFQWK